MLHHVTREIVWAIVLNRVMLWDSLPPFLCCISIKSIKWKLNTFAKKRKRKNNNNRTRPRLHSNIDIFIICNYFFANYCHIFLWRTEYIIHNICMFVWENSSAAVLTSRPSFLGLYSFTDYWGLLHDHWKEHCLLMESLNHRILTCCDISLFYSCIG